MASQPASNEMKCNKKSRSFVIKMKTYGKIVQRQMRQYKNFKPAYWKREKIAKL